jgi:hypothetical protein
MRLSISIARDKNVHETTKNAHVPVVNIVSQQPGYLLPSVSDLYWQNVTFTNICRSTKVKINLFLCLRKCDTFRRTHCLIKHNVVKTYWGVEV